MDVEECVRAAAAGDFDAQGALMARYLDLARRTARRLVDDPATADDVVQEHTGETGTWVDPDDARQALAELLGSGLTG